MNLKLNAEDVKFAYSKSIDTNGHVFYWEDNVYRAVSPSIAPVYKTLLESEHVRHLFDMGLIETQPAPIELDGFSLVLKHQKIQFISYATEWCGSMLKDAALLTLDLSLALAELGLELQDAHPWNILFDGCQARFIDFGSIIPSRKNDSWKPYQEFIGMFYNPLQLMAAGYPDDARSLFVDPITQKGHRIQTGDVIRTFIKRRSPGQILKTLGHLRPAPKQGKIETIKDLRHRISEIEIPLPKTRWSDYALEEVDLSTFNEWIVKRKTVYDVISRCRPKTTLDIGSNSGWFSKLAAIHGSKVIATDKDETCINRLYQNEIAQKQSILPLAMDFRNPTPAYGIDLRCAPAVDRLKCEMVLGLAIVHHLVFVQKIDFATIIGNLAALTSRWLLVEFIPQGDKHIAKWNPSDYPWYTAETFAEELEKYFSKIERLPSNPEPRFMFLCER